MRGCAFLDAGQIIGSSERDGIHFEVEAHQTLGRTVARIVQELLGVSQSPVCVHIHPSE